MLGRLSQVLCCYSQNLSAYQWMYLQVQTYAVNFFFFVLKSEACLQTVSSSKVRLVYKLSVRQKWGLVIESFYKVLQDCRFLKSEAWCFYFKSQLWLWYCFLYEWLILLLTIQIYNKDFSHKLYFFMCFVATKMGPHCKEMQNHGKQRCIKMTHF